MTSLLDGPLVRSVGGVLEMGEALCTIDGCGKRHLARGWCSMHYRRWKQHGDPCATVGQSARRPLDHEDGTRTCKKCATRKPIDAYGVDASATLGRRATCSACRNFQMAGYYDLNADRIKSRVSQYRESRPEVVRESERARYARHREKRIELAVEHTHVRRARLRSVAADRGITHAALRDRDGTVCRYCSREMDFSRAKRGEATGLRANIDHVIPVSKGGTHTWGNVVLACRDCNYSKGAKSLDEWNDRPSFDELRPVV